MLGENKLFLLLNPAEGAGYNHLLKNAGAFVSRHAGCQVVSGWLIKDFVGFSCFNAHSVVRDFSRQLIYPTPIKSPADGTHGALPCR